MIFGKSFCWNSRHNFSFTSCFIVYVIICDTWTSWMTFYAGRNKIIHQFQFLFFLYYPRGFVWRMETLCKVWDFFWGDVCVRGPPSSDQKSFSVNISSAKVAIVALIVEKMSFQWDSHFFELSKLCPRVKSKFLQAIFILAWKRYGSLVENNWF